MNLLLPSNLIRAENQLQILENELKFLGATYGPKHCIRCDLLRTTNMKNFSIENLKLKATGSVKVRKLQCIFKDSY